MEKEFPWLIEEKNKIKEYVINLKKPYLGFCLGCQLLGEVLGGNRGVMTPGISIGSLGTCPSDCHVKVCVQASRTYTSHHFSPTQCDVPP